MPLATREIKRRIRSIGNTRKITKGMELIAALKMRKAVKAVLATRAYARAAWEIIKNLSAKTDPAHHPLMQKRKNIKKIALILITANRGLCAGFNREVIEAGARYLADQKKRFPSVETEAILLGSKGKEIMYRFGHKIVAEFPKEDVSPGVTEITALAKVVVEGFTAGQFDKAVIAYSDYYSAIKQQPRVKRLLPLEPEDEELGFIGTGQPEDNITFEYIFEPSPEAVLDQMLCRIIELQIYQAVLESNASEHSARMIAMKNATEAAGDIMSDLTLALNQYRQQSITTELIDICSGAYAGESLN